MCGGRAFRAGLRERQIERIPPLQNFAFSRRQRWPWLLGGTFGFGLLKFDILAFESSRHDVLIIPPIDFERACDLLNGRPEARMDNPNRPEDNDEDIPMPEESTEEGPYRSTSNPQDREIANDDPGDDDFEDVDGDLDTDSEPKPDAQR